MSAQINMQPRGAPDEEEALVRQLLLILHGNDDSQAEANLELGEPDELNIKLEERARCRLRGHTLPTIKPVYHLSPSKEEPIIRKNFGRKLNHRLILFFALFCNLDLFAREQPNFSSVNQKDRPETDDLQSKRWIGVSLFKGFIKIRLFAYRVIKPSHWYQRTRSKLWPKLVLAAYLACIAHLSYNLYHQYIYDYYRFRLARVRWLNQTKPQAILIHQLEREDFLLERINVTGQRMLSIGAPHMHLSYAVQCVYMLIMLTSALIYLFAQFYFRYRVPFDFYFIHNFLDYSNGQRNCWWMINKEVRRFMESSKNYTRALVEFSERSVGKRLLFQRYTSKLRQLHPAQMGGLLTKNSTDAGVLSEFAARQSVDSAIHLEKLIYAESLSCKQLRQLLNHGELRPPNQAASWVRNQSRLYSHICTHILALSILFDLTVAVLMTTRSVRQLELRDLLVGAEFIFILTVCNITYCFLSSIIVFACYDQVKLVDKLNQLIELVISLNNLRFYKNLHLKAREQKLELARRRGRMSTGELTNESASLITSLAKKPVQLTNFNSAYEDAMNKDMLLILMQYKIFVAQIMVFKRPLRTMVFAIVFSMFLFPIVGRLHLPYFDSQMVRNMRMLVVIISVSVIIPVDVNLIPICYLHRRCTILYNQLNRLMAHATEIINQPEGRDIYDRHIISILRKEMSYPEWKASQFSIHINGLSLTYPSLVRLHFYFSFIILSILAENQASQQEVVGTLFNDPFGLF